MSTLSPIEALEAIVKMKREPGETTDTYVFNRCWRIASEALAAHHQQGGKEAQGFVDFYAKTITDDHNDRYDIAEHFKAGWYARSSPSTATGGWVKAAGMKDGIYPVKFISKLSGVKMYGVGQVLNEKIHLARFYNGTTLSSSDPDIDAYVLSDTAPAIDIKKEIFGIIDFMCEVNENGIDGERIILSDGELYWEADEDGDQPISAEEFYSLYKKSQP